MIKVLHMITRLIIGGAQENTMLTADYLNHDPQYQSRYDVSVLSGIQTGPEGSLIEEVQQREVPLTLMPELVRELNPVKDLVALVKMRRLLTGSSGAPNYDIVHTHSSKAGILGRIAARWAGIPIIVHTVHGWSFHERMSAPKRRLYVILEQLCARYSDALIVVTARDIEKGLAAGIAARDRYTVIRSGIEMDRFGQPRIPPQAMRAQLGIPESTLVVGSVTRLSPQKAPMDLVAAFARVRQHCPQAWFVIVGDGPQRAQVEAYLAANDLQGCTILTGLRRDIPELMAAFDIFVLSSLWEGLPRVLPQAMASGKALVCTRVDGSSEVVTDGETGWLVPPGQPEALAAKIVALIHDPEMRQRMGASGQQRSAGFSAQVMVQEIDRLYQRLMQGKIQED